MQNADKVWQIALAELELQMTRATFDTWVRPTVSISWDQDIFVLGAPNAYIKDWLENRLYVPIIFTSLINCNQSFNKSTS